MAAPLRIYRTLRGADLGRRPPTDDDVVAALNAPEPPPPTTRTEDIVKGYLDRLVKMIPGEVVAFYLGGAGIIPKEYPWVLVIWALIGLIGLIGIRSFATSDPDKNLGPQWPAIIISAIAYFIWLYAIGGPFASFDLYLPWLATLLVSAWTFLVPIFYRGN